MPGEKCPAKKDSRRKMPGEKCPAKKDSRRFYDETGTPLCPTTVSRLIIRFHNRRSLASNAITSVRSALGHNSCLTLLAVPVSKIRWTVCWCVCVSQNVARYGLRSSALKRPRKTLVRKRDTPARKVTDRNEARPAFPFS